MSRQTSTIKLCTVADVLQGQSPESIYYSDSEGIPFLQGNRTFGNLYPFFDTYTKKVTKLARTGDVLMSVRAPVGALNFAPCDLCIGRGLASIKAKNGDNNFVYYALRYNVANLVKQGGATTFDSVNKELIENFDLVIPSDEIDRKNSALLLSSLDQKVELNNKINSELEAMAKLIYDYWFVQFDFPDENGRPYKSSGGEMMWNDELKKQIPVGWIVKNLNELIKEAKNGDWGSDTVNEGSDQSFCIRGADINGLNGIENFDPPIRNIDKSHSNRQLKPDDLIIEISGGSPTQSTGRMAHISSYVLVRLGNKAVCSNFCKAISLINSKLSYIVSRYWSHLYDSKVFFNYEGKTSGIKNLLFDQLSKDVIIAIPSDENLINKYYELEESIDRQKQNNLQHNEELVKLRDWLLPMLMNGQVTIKN